MTSHSQQIGPIESTLVILLMVFTLPLQPAIASGPDIGGSVNITTVDREDEPRSGESYGEVDIAKADCTYATTYMNAFLQGFYCGPEELCPPSGALIQGCMPKLECLQNAMQNPGYADMTDLEILNHVVTFEAEYDRRGRISHYRVKCDICYYKNGGAAFGALLTGGAIMGGDDPCHCNQ